MANTHTFEEILLADDIFCFSGYADLTPGQDADTDEYGRPTEAATSGEIDNLTLDVNVLFTSEGKATRWLPNAQNLFDSAFVELLKEDAAKGIEEANYSDIAPYLTAKGQRLVEDAIWEDIPMDFFAFEDEPDYYLN